MKSRPVLSSMIPYTPGLLVPGKLKLASNENPLGPSPRAMEAFAECAGRLQLYPDGGCSLLTDALATRWNLDRDRFVLGNGSDEVLVMIAAAFLNPGDHVLVGAHTFSEYRFASLLFDGTVESVPMPGGRFDTALFASRLKPATKAVFLCSPNNPTGTLIGRQELETFLAKVPAEVLVVLDAAYAEYCNDPTYPGEAELLARWPNLLILHTFSKIYGIAGLRVGYAMGAPDLIREIAKVRQPFNVNLPAQAAATAALGDHDFVERSRRMNAEGRTRLYGFFRGLGLDYLESEANFVAADTGRDSKKVFEATMEAGVTIRPMTSFGLPSWVRVTVGTPEDLDRFEAAFRQALAVVAPLPKA